MNIFNQVAINPAVAPLIDGVPVTRINPADVLGAQKRAKAKGIVGYAEWLATGVDLSAQIPDCTESTPVLTALTDLVNTYWKNTQYTPALPFVAYSAKQKQFVVTTEGQAKLASKIITLNAVEAETYQTIIALSDYVRDKFQPEVMSKLFGEETYSRGRDEMKTESIVRYLKKNSK